MVKTIRMPAEWESHLRTFMVWPQSSEIWENKLLREVRKDIANIANAIVPFEPVVMITDPAQSNSVQTQLHPNVSIIVIKVDDLWARDTLPAFVSEVENKIERAVGVVFNFNGWGKKQIHANDAQVARKVLELYDMQSRTAQLVAEGGSFETDGEGTLLVTKSSLVNENRNNKSIDEIEIELKNVLGMKKIIWFDGVKGEDITDAHVDCLVRFVRPGTVIVNRPFAGEPADVWSKSSDQALTILKNSTDANGNSFKIIELFEPDPNKILIKGDAGSFLSSYVNFYIANGCVIVPVFGDNESDLKAQTILREQFPERIIVPVQVSALASGGGGIHCATHEQPAMN